MEQFVNYAGEVEKLYLRDDEQFVGEMFFHLSSVRLTFCIRVELIDCKPFKKLKKSSLSSTYILSQFHAIK